MTIMDILAKTRVCLGLFDHPTCGIGLYPCKDGHIFLTFSKLDEADQKLAFGESVRSGIVISEEDADVLKDAIFLNDLATWDNFVHIINTLDKRYKAFLKEHENEGLHDGTS
mgnify:FL=1